MKIKLRKLFGMSAGEIAFRLKHKVSLMQERSQFRSRKFSWDDAAWSKRLCCDVEAPLEAGQLSEWWQNHMRTRDEPAMLLSPDEQPECCDLYQELFSARRGDLIAAGDAVCEGHLSFLGKEVSLDDPIDWHRDPRTGHQWGAEFHGDIEFAFCQTGGDDVKYVWELGRQEYLIDCAKAYRLTGEARYADRVAQIALSWIESNPYLEGVHWASALEVAVRSLSWLWSYQFCRPEFPISADAHLAWIQSFYQHGAYLHRHLSYYFSPNNHLIGEATALYLLGCFFPEFDESAAWREHGWSVVSEYHQRQYYADGGSTEQATFYHNYCLGFLLLAVLTRQRQKNPVPEEMLACIERALQFTMWMTRSDGTVPRIGDVDNARSIAFENPPLWDFRNLLSLGAVLFRRGDMKQVAGGFSEDALWLLGREGYQQYCALEARAPRENSRAFPQSGYYVMRTGWREAEHHLAFDCGPIAAGLHADAVPSSAHGHSDLLSFTLAAHGKPLIVDGGFYTYDEDPLWHRYFREASAHNTLLVDGASHANFHPSNAWSSVATPESMQWHSTSLFEYVESGHAGFFGVVPAVRHRRALFWDLADKWVILDRLEGEGVHDVEVFFHFAPCEATLLGDRQGVAIKTAQGALAELVLLEGADCQIEIIAGRSGPEGGWIGTGYGYRQRAPVARFFGRFQLPVAFSFAIESLHSPSTENG